MREFPVEFSGLLIERAELKLTVPDPSHGNYLGIVSGRENLICLLKVLVSESRLDYLHSCSAQEPDHPLSSDACKKCSIRDRCQHYAIFGHEDIRSREFSDVAQHVAYNRIVKPPLVRFKERA